MCNGNEDGTLPEWSDNSGPPQGDSGAPRDADSHGTTPQGSPVALPIPGQSWGKYLIEKRLGSGGQAEVYQAYDRFGAAGHVALKVPRHPVPPETIEQWSAAEADPLVRLDHPGIAKVVDAGCVGAVPYVATRLIEGQPLDKYVEAHPPAPGQVLDWMIRLADALDSAHEAGVVHRDLKPGNVVIDAEGSPRLIDLGIARLVSPYPQSPPDGTTGTPQYIAPEQARGEPSADHRVDVFGLGGVLKFLLTRVGPYGLLASRDAYLEAAREGRVQPADASTGPPLRRALARIANRATAADPRQRYRTAGEMRQALRRLRARRTLIAAVAAGVALLAGIVALAAVLAGRGGGPAGVSAELEIHFQRADQKGSYQVLTADLLPLCDGDRIQAHARFGEPLYAYLLALSSSGQPSVLYPAAGAAPEATRDVSIPPGRDRWLPLTPPGGTETVLLLARRRAPGDADDLAKEVLSRGRPPAFDGVGLLVCDGRGLRYLPNKAATQRTIGEKAVTVDKGLLASLLEAGSDKWEVVRAISFTHAERPMSTPASPEAKP